jgi:hypothetical protein
MASDVSYGAVPTSLRSQKERVLHKFTKKAIPKVYISPTLTLRERENFIESQRLKEI